MSCLKVNTVTEMLHSVVSVIRGHELGKAAPNRNPSGQAGPCLVWLSDMVDVSEKRVQVLGVDVHASNLKMQLLPSFLIIGLYAIEGSGRIVGVAVKKAEDGIYVVSLV